MSKDEIISLLKSKGYRVVARFEANIYNKTGFTIEPGNDGLLIEVNPRAQIYEQNYNDFLYETLEGNLPAADVIMLDNWSFTIKCK